MLLRLGEQMIIADRMPGGAPGPAYGVSGWGMPSYATQVPLLGLGASMRPQPVGARYFCGDDYPMYEAQTEPCASGNRYNSTKSQYQEAVTKHYTEEHPDLHYPLPQDDLDQMHAAKAKADKLLRLNAQLEELAEWEPPGVGGGVEATGAFDLSGDILPVTRPRELPDFTEFDFPDANVADAATEEIELDQLISIAARQGRRFLGVEIQNLSGAEYPIEFATAASAALDITSRLELNTRTGSHNLDDPEQLWRQEAAVTIVDFETAGPPIYMAFSDQKTPPPGGRVYVAPRLFWRFVNNLDRQVDTGDLFCIIASVDQPLSTFLLFELLEEFSGLFGLT